MHKMTRWGTRSTALIGAVLCAAATWEIPAAVADGATTVVLDWRMRRCDFSAVTTTPMVPRTGLATGTVLVRSTGSNAVAEVHLVDPPEPGTHFDVGLIQEPRPAAGGCGPGDPGTAFAGLDTDAAGSGTVTVQDAIRPGTKGVWVIVERPDPHSQTPAEFYTSEFLAPV